MSLSKTQAYQQRILQTLKREQAAAALSAQLQRENQAFRAQINRVNRECEALREGSEAEIARAEMEVRMAKMGKIAQEERNEEMAAQLSQLQLALTETTAKRQRAQEESRTLRKQCEQTGLELARQTEKAVHCEQRNARLQEQLRNCTQQIATNQSQIQELHRDKSFLSRSNAKLQSQANDLSQQLQQAIAKLQSVKNQQKSNALAKLEKQQESSKYQLKLQQLSKQNAFLKQRTSKLQEHCQELQLNKEQTEDALKRAEKTIKKNKEIIAEHEARIRELQEQISICSEKNRNLERGLKSAKRELQALQEALANADQSKAAELAKYKKWQSLSRSQQSALLQKDQQLQQLKEGSSQLKKELQLSQRSALELSFQLQKSVKENKYLSEQWQQQQEKRILLQAQKERAISSIIREKDVLGRANYKLLQLFQLKDKTLNAILDAVHKQTDSIEVVVELEGDGLLREINKMDREKLRNGKERVKLLEEWLRGRK